MLPYVTWPMTSSDDLVWPWNFAYGYFRYIFLLVRNTFILPKLDSFWDNGHFKLSAAFLAAILDSGHTATFFWEHCKNLIRTIVANEKIRWKLILGTPSLWLPYYSGNWWNWKTSKLIYKNRYFRKTLKMAADFIGDILNRHIELIHGTIGFFQSLSDPEKMAPKIL